MTSSDRPRAAFLPPIQTLRAALHLSDGEIDGPRYALVPRRMLRFLLSLLAERIEFDARAYQAANPDILDGFGYDEAAARNHFLTQGYFEGRTGWGPPFDAEWYAAAYPDVAEQLGADPRALLEHYVTQGIREGRAPNEACAAEAARWAAALQTS